METLKVKLQKMENKIEVLEFNTVAEAESEYLKRHAEGTWVIVDRLKVVWSWKKFKSVCRFSMKRVEQRPMYIVEFMGKLRTDVLPTISNTFAMINEMKRKRKIRLALQKLEGI